MAHYGAIGGAKVPRGGGHGANGGNMRRAQAALIAVGALALFTVALLGFYTNKAGPAELMMKVRNNRRIGLMARQPRFVRGMMTAAEFKELLENEEEHNVFAICGASTCKAFKGCNQQEFAACVSMDGLERQRFVVASLPSLNIMEGPVAQLPFEEAVAGPLSSLAADTTAANCGTAACSASGCDNQKFFSCFASKEAENEAFAEDYPEAIKSMTGLVQAEVEEEQKFASIQQKNIEAKVQHGPQTKGLKTAKLADMQRRTMLDNGILMDLPPEANLETGFLGSFPVDSNLEGSLAKYPIDTNLAGELSAYPADTNLAGELSVYPIDTNLAGELSAYPEEPNLLTGYLAMYPEEKNLLIGELGQYPVDTVHIPKVMCHTKSLYSLYSLTTRNLKKL